MSQGGGGFGNQGGGGSGGFGDSMGFQEDNMVSVGA